MRRRDAVLFARTSMVLATIIATSIIAGLFAYRQNPMPTVDDASYWITPIFALTDTLWGVLPLALSIYVIQWVGLSCLHGILSWGAAPGVARRRASRAAMYVWALAPVEAALMSAVFVGLAIGTGEDAWVDALRGWIIAGTIAAAGVALAITLYAGWVLAIKWGRWKRLRGLMIMGFLPAVLVFQFFVMCVVFWIVGYVAIAIVSMAH